MPSKTEVPAIEAPATFAITSATQGNQSVILTWVNSAGADRYEVSYGTVSGVYDTVATLNAVSPLELTGLSSGVTYYFQVTAVNSAHRTVSNEMSQQAIFYDDFNRFSMGPDWYIGNDPSSFSAQLNMEASINVSFDGAQVVFEESDVEWRGQTLETRQDFNLTNAWISVDMVAPFNIGPYRESGVWVIDENADGWEMYAAEGSLHAGSYYGSGAQDMDDFLYDPVAHRYLRIRHVEGTPGQIIFEASPDEVVWSNIRTMDRDVGIDVNRMHPMVYSFQASRSNILTGEPAARFNHLKTNATYSVLPD